MNGFALWLGIGAALGLWRVAQHAPRQQASAWLDISLLVLLGSLIGARAFYVVVHWPYYQNQPGEIAQFWMGGLSWPGAWLGALAVMLVLRATRTPSRGKQISLGILTDRLYPLLPPLVIAAWLGCWSVGAAYGPSAPAQAWWAVPSLDESGFYNLHWPTQPIAAASLLIFFWLLETRLPSSTRPGWLSGIAISGLLLHSLVTSLLIADPSPTWNGLRPETWMALAFLVFFCIFMIYRILLDLLRRGTAPTSSNLKLE